MKVKELSDDDDLQKFLILMIGIDGEPVRGKFKLQNMMFLLANNLKEIGERCGYQAGDSGPHSRIVDEELRYLKQMGIVSGGKSIALTGAGRGIFEELAKKEDRYMLDVLSDYKELFGDIPVKELLAFVYLAYPEMAADSARYKELRPDMEKYILSLVEKQKITSQRGAELLHKPQEDIIKRMKGRLVLEY